MPKWMKRAAPALVVACAATAFAAPDGPGGGVAGGPVDLRGNVAAAQGQPRTRVIVYQDLWYGFPASTDTTQFTYDRHGNCIREDRTWDGANDGTIDSTTTILREFDAGNHVVREETVYADVAGNPWSRFLETFTRDDAGRLLERSWEYDEGADGVLDQWETEVRTWDAQGRPLTQSRSYTMSYAVWGMQGGFTESSATSYSAWDAHGNATRWTTDAMTEDSIPDFDWYWVSVRSSSTSAAYDGRGNLLSEVTLIDHGSDGTPDRREEATFSRSARGDVLTETRTGDDGLDGTIDSLGATQRSYDRRGNSTGFRFLDDWDNDGAPEFDYTESVTRDRFGNPVHLVYDSEILGIPFAHDEVFYTY
jgi:hypothetical protein